MSIEWEPWGGWADRSVCKRYSVSVATVEEGRRVFTLWILPKTIHSQHKSAKSAKAAAEKLSEEG